VRLTVWASGGLCNRLKPILSGLDIARRTGRRLRVYWDERLVEYPESLSTPIEYIWPGSFSDLFATDIEEITREEAEALQRASPEWCEPQANPWDFPIVDPADTRHDILRSSWQFLRMPAEPAYDCRVDGFDPRLVDAFAACRPAPELVARVEDFAAAHGLHSFPSIGLHVRSRHAWCKRYVAADYIRAVEVYRRTNTAGPMFISSDCPQIEDEIRRALPSLISVLKESYDCVPSLASGDAVIDLCLLSRAKVIIGTPASTFAHVAWYLSGCRSQFIDIGKGKQ
jgi:hypothetical protein